MSTVGEQIRAQIVGALQGASFPIESPQALLAAFPNGADTTCKADGVEVTAGEAGKLLQQSDFPFTGPEHVADTIASRAGL